MRKTAHFTNPGPDQQASGTEDNRIPPDLCIIRLLLIPKRIQPINAAILAVILTIPLTQRGIKLNRMKTNHITLYCD
jgi:hypothetical protein